MSKLIPRIPKFLIFLFLFITAFLLGFLLLSCYNETKAYKSIYLTRYLFNEDLLLAVTFNGTETNAELLSTFTISVGYLSFCVEYDGLISCAPFDKLDKLSRYPIISVDAGNEGMDLDLVKLSQRFNEICYSYVLMAAIIMVLISLLLSLWNMIPLLPWKKWINMIMAGVSLVNTIIWGIGAMLQHQAAKSSQMIIPVASMNLIDANSGSKAEAISWTAFAFIAVVLIGNTFVVVRSFQTSNDPMVNRKY